MATTIPQGDYGIASVQTDAYQDNELFAGDTPAVVTQSFKVGADLAADLAGGIFPAWTPVYDDASGNVAKASMIDGDARPANGITVFPVETVEGNAVSVYKAGTFNLEALTWDSVDGTTPYSEWTDEIKAAYVASAFTAANDHQLYLKLPFYGRA